MQSIIEVQNLHKTYQLKNQTPFKAIDNISFEVYQGEIFGILGPNGAGKTTTLEIIEGLKEQTSGTVKVCGFDNVLETESLKQIIGIQLQSCEYLPSLTLTELLKLFRAFYRHKNPDQNLLKKVNLENKAKEYVQNLSGGQKQRFTIATALVNQPQILFLDEPTTGLDPASRRNMWSLIKQLNQTGITIILTTHYMEEAEYLCNRVAIMDKGKILKINEPKKIIEELNNTIQISFLVELPFNEDWFKQLSGVKKVYNTFPKIILEIDSLDNLPAILALLKKEQINFSSFSVKTANLEDVYLQLTGHEYER